jgi:hypothetical protein
MAQTLVLRGGSSPGVMDVGLLGNPSSTLGFRLATEAIPIYRARLNTRWGIMIAIFPLLDVQTRLVSRDLTKTMRVSMSALESYKMCTLPGQSSSQETRQRYKHG